MRTSTRGPARTSFRALQSNRYARTLTGTVAVILLDGFLADPALWRECGHLNGWDSHTDPTFRDYLHSWDAHLREYGPRSRLPSVIADLFKLNP